MNKPTEINTKDIPAMLNKINEKLNRELKRDLEYWANSVLGIDCYTIKTYGKNERQMEKLKAAGL